MGSRDRVLVESVKNHAATAPAVRATAPGSVLVPRSLPLAEAGNRAVAQRLTLQRDRAADLAACQSVLLAADADINVLHGVQDFTVVDTSDRLTLIRRINADSWVGSDDEAALVRLWRSAGMDAVAAQHQDVYQASRDGGAELPATLSSFGTFTNRITQNMTEGATTVVKGRFSWTLVDDKLEVEVPVHFAPADGVAVPKATWDGQIDGVWNQFAVTDRSDGKKVPVTMKLKDIPGDARTINVVDNKVSGTYGNGDRANAGKWYPVMPASTAPHEFGHLIGLPDEYQRTHEDFKAITGGDKAGPAAPTAKTPEAVAAELHAALTAADETTRAAGATTVLTGANLISGGAAVQGDFAQKVMKAYDDKYENIFRPSLLQRLQRLKKDNWILMSVFSYASGTVMGNPDAIVAEGHDHPVEPRHLREFVNIVKGYYPARTWEIGPK